MFISSTRRIKSCLFFTCLFLSIFLAYKIFYSHFRVLQEQVISASEPRGQNMEENQKEKRDLEYLNRSVTYTILYYNQPAEWKNGNDVVNFKKCPYTDCSVTTERSRMMDCEAVIFQHKSLPVAPPIKNHKQVWIFTSSESPYYTRRPVLMPKWRHVFDWSMSYRRDSDVFLGYGLIIPRKTPLVRDYDLVFSEKKGEVAWIVSNCRTQSKREKYVEELKKHIKVDIFGKCGEACEAYRFPGNDSCHKRISRDYKFYLSFENSLCVDYTSEKLYYIYELDFPILPVVRGALTGKTYIPNGTYIDTLDFKTPKDLAKILKEIGNNKSKYAKMLRAKDAYTSEPYSRTYEDALCNLCQLLHRGNLNRPPLNVSQWFLVDSCREPFDLG